MAKPDEEIEIMKTNFTYPNVDDEDLPEVVSDINESLDMFKRFNKFN